MDPVVDFYTFLQVGMGMGASAPKPIRRRKVELLQDL